MRSRTAAVVSWPQRVESIHRCNQASLVQRKTGRRIQPAARSEKRVGRECYWSGVVDEATRAAVNGTLPLPVVFWKIVPRWSVPNERPPVEPAVSGCASPKYDATASALETLQVLAARVTVVPTVPAPMLTRNPLLVTPFALRSGLRKPAVLPVGGFTRSASVVAYPPLAQLDEYVDWALLIARSEPIADASLPDIRARSRPGTAIAAMIPMMATTISSSISVKPFALRIFMSMSFMREVV